MFFNKDFRILCANHVKPEVERAMLIQVHYTRLMKRLQKRPLHTPAVNRGRGGCTSSTSAQVAISLLVKVDGCSTGLEFLSICSRFD